MKRFEAIVVGAGAMGSSAAWWLSRRGLSVLVLERFQQGHHFGSSHGSSRIFRLAYPQAAYVPLAMRALHLWRELEDEASVSILEQTGGVDHGIREVTDGIRAGLDQNGVSHEVLRPEEAQDRFRGMRFEGEVIFQRDAGRTNADVAVRAMQDQAGRHGAELRFEEGAEKVDVDGDEVVVRTSLDEYRAPVGVFTPGAWITDLIGHLVELPNLRVTQEQPAHFRPIDPDVMWPSFIHHPPLDSEISSFDKYGLQSPFEGVKVGEHMAGVVPDLESRDFDPDATRLGRLTRYVEQWFPGLDPKPTEVITCLYTTTANHDFILDRKGPLVIGSVCSGHGFKFTPLIGQLLADLAMGKDEIDARFRLPQMT